MGETNVRTQIKQVSKGIVSVDGALRGERVEWLFMAPVRGGYVRRWNGQEWSQCFGSICGQTGSALEVSSADKLLPLVRRGWKAYRAAQ